MDVGTILFLAVLAIWSGGVAYYILFWLTPLFSGVKKNGENAPLPPEGHAGARRTATHPELFEPKIEVSLPPPVRQSARDGFKAFASGPELTVEDIVKGLSRRE